MNFRKNEKLIVQALPTNRGRYHQLEGDRYIYIDTSTGCTSYHITTRSRYRPYPVSIDQPASRYLLWMEPALDKGFWPRFA
jgi:hypothetical protein